MFLRYVQILLVARAIQADKIEANIKASTDENQTRCYDDLGCLNITESWYHWSKRPINLFPLPRSVINTSFILYTRSNPNKGTYLKVEDENSIENSEFSPNKSTKFIVHGFLDTPLSKWVRDMKDELIKAGDMNIIVVDWAGGSLSLYTQATANTRLVGLEITHLIKFLLDKYDMDPRDIHIIGFSLGAHTAGYTGTMIPGLGRITGLDPAELYFQEMPPHVILDPTDAEFVDVIHTDGSSMFFLGYGMSQPCGHLDFYPNNGKEQPGCDFTQTPLIPLTLIQDGPKEASRTLVACSHNRALQFFIDSINNECLYIGHQCSNFEQFMAGKSFTCKPGSTKCAIMGYHSPGFANSEMTPSELPDLIGKKYFLITGPEFPFCQRLYRVSIELAKPKDAETWVQGFIKASIYSLTGVKHVDLTLSDETKLVHGTTFTSVVSHPEDLGSNIKKVELSWEYESNILKPKTICSFWCNDHLYVESVSIEKTALPGRGKQDVPFSNKLCPKGKKSYSDIASGGKGIFVNSCKN